MKYLILLLVTNCFANVDLGLEIFNSNEDITAEKYNINYIKIHNELSKREFVLPFNTKQKDDIIEKQDLLNDINSILNLKNIEHFNIIDEQISSDKINQLFSKIQNHINFEFKNKSCSIDKSYSCNKSWDEDLESYSWDFECFPNYDKVSQDEHSCNIKNNINFSISGSGGWQSQNTVLPGQRIYLNCHSGYVTLGKSGGYNCSNDSSAYATSYRLTSGCTGGSPLYRTVDTVTGATSGYNCARNVYFENSTDNPILLQYIINDSDRSNNSGSVNFTVVYQEQF